MLSCPGTAISERTELCKQTSVSAVGSRSGAQMTWPRCHRPGKNVSCRSFQLRCPRLLGAGLRSPAAVVLLSPAVSWSAESCLLPVALLSPVCSPVAQMGAAGLRAGAVPDRSHPRCTRGGARCRTDVTPGAHAPVSQLGVHAPPAAVTSCSQLRTMCRTKPPACAGGSAVCWGWPMRPSAWPR